MLDCGFQETFGRLNIIPHKFVGIEAANLRMADDERVTSGKRALPYSRVIHCRQVSLYRAHRRELLPEGRYVRCMLIDADELTVAPCEEARGKILADEPSCSRDDDLSSLGHGKR